MTKVTYEFEAFPADYWPQDRHGENHGYRFGVLSRFTYNTLKEARQEVRRLKRIAKLCDRETSWLDEDLLKIERVEKTTV